MMTYDYARSEPGHPGISLHCDGQPWGSEIFGYGQSCPRLVRVLYYLDDLTREVSPFKVLPRSHLSFHHEGNPYLRYAEHPEQVMVTCEAGSAVLISQNVFHGNYPNIGGYSRELLGIAYRPAWAGPGGEVEPWDPDQLAKVPRDRARADDRSQYSHLELRRRQQACRDAAAGARDLTEPMGASQLSATARGVTRISRTLIALCRPQPASRS